jgi:tRNA threonylcarbamoyladenosine biosynthesis protein TsaE
MATTCTLILYLPDEAATDRLGQQLGALLRPGDTVLLRGQIGAGKSHLARSLIRARLGRPEEPVPSPTFTLVQAYDSPTGDIWHADLYRLGDASEVVELGLDSALSQAICLIEWPERLGEMTPEQAVTLDLAPDGDGRRVSLSGTGRGAAIIAALAELRGRDG